jgi:hypothetical protein
MQTIDYIKQRVESQIKWYNSNSSFNRYCYITTKVVLTIVAAIIPTLTAFVDNNTSIKITIGVLSVLTGILANITGIFKFKENWVQYRNMCELLQSEKFLFISESGKYKDGATREKLYVETVEGYLQNENKKWADNVNSVKSL